MSGAERPGHWATVGAWSDGSGAYSLEVSGDRTRAVLHYAGGDEHTPWRLTPVSDDWTGPIVWADYALTDGVAITVDYTGPRDVLVRLGAQTYLASDRAEYGPVHVGASLFAADLEPGDRIEDSDGDPVDVLEVGTLDGGPVLRVGIRYADGSTGRILSDPAEVWAVTA